VKQPKIPDRDHTVPNVEQIGSVVGINSIEDGLGIVDKEGTKTLLLFEGAA